MDTNVITGAGGVVESLRPSRVNPAGVCRYCLRPGCVDVSCVEMYEATAWTVCVVCGGTEYVNGHLDREDAGERCSSSRCYGGLVMWLGKGA